MSVTKIIYSVILVTMYKQWKHFYKIQITKPKLLTQFLHYTNNQVYQIIPINMFM